jgi:hypothetical protein
MSNRHTKLAEELLSVRPVTRDLVTSVLRDVWPGHAAIVDFGIDSQKHYEALYHPIHEAEILPKALDAALGDGAALTELTRQAPSNPHKDVTFSTSWDVILGRATERDSFKAVLDGKSAIARAPEKSKDREIEM